MKIPKIHITLALIFLFIGVLYRFAEFYWIPTDRISGDAQIIACMAAAKEDPEAFQKDYCFKDLDNIRFYTPLYVGLIRVLKGITGDYIKAHTVQMEVIVFLHLLGYYLLAFQLSRRVVVSVLYSLVMLCPLYFSLGEFWGFDGTRHILPRTLFSVILPFVMMLTFRWRTEPAKWPIAALLVGAMIYVHPVSAPAILFGTYFYWIYQSIEQKLPNKLFVLIKSGFFFAIPVVPYLIFYLIYRKHGDPGGLDFNLVKAAMLERMSPEWFDVKKCIELIYQASGIGNHLMRLGGVISFLLIFYKPARVKALGILAFLSGAMFVSTVVPYMEHLISQWRSEFPMQIDLVRGFRYMVPLFFLGYPLLYSAADGWKPAARWTAKIIVVLILGHWIYNNHPKRPVGAAYAWFVENKLAPHGPDSIAKLKDYHALREGIRTYVPRGALLHSDGFLDTRYNLYKPLFFAFKDGGIFVQSNWVGLLEWQRRKRLVEESVGNQATDFAKALEILKQEKVEYWLIPTDSNLLSSSKGRWQSISVWTDGRYAILKI